MLERHVASLVTAIALLVSCGTSTPPNGGACECGEPNANPCQQPPACSDACNDVIAGECGTGGTFTCSSTSSLSPLCASASQCAFRVAVVDSHGGVTCEDAPVSCAAQVSCACVDPTAFGCPAGSTCMSAPAGKKLVGAAVVIQCDLPPDAGSSDAQTD